MSVLKPTELLHFKVAGRDFAVDEAVGILLLRAVQLLTVLIDMLQHPAAVRRRQLEPHLRFWAEGNMFFTPLCLKDFNMMFLAQ